MAKAEKFFLGTGRRKNSTARVFLKYGKGDIVVNGVPWTNILAGKPPEWWFINR